MREKLFSENIKSEIELPINQRLLAGDRRVKNFNVDNLAEYKTIKTNTIVKEKFTEEMFFKNKFDINNLEDTEKIVANKDITVETGNSDYIKSILAEVDSLGVIYNLDDSSKKSIIEYFSKTEDWYLAGMVLNSLLNYNSAILDSIKTKHPYIIKLLNDYLLTKHISDSLLIQQKWLVKYTNYLNSNCKININDTVTKREKEIIINSLNIHDNDANDLYHEWNDAKSKKGLINKDMEVRSNISKNMCTQDDYEYMLKQITEIFSVSENEYRNLVEYRKSTYSNDKKNYAKSFSPAIAFESEIGYLYDLKSSVPTIDLNNLKNHIIDYYNSWNTNFVYRNKWNKIINSKAKRKLVGKLKTIFADSSFSLD